VPSELVTGKALSHDKGIIMREKRVNITIPSLPVTQYNHTTETSHAQETSSAEPDRVRTPPGGTIPGGHGRGNKGKRILPPLGLSGSGHGGYPSVAQIPSGFPSYSPSGGLMPMPQRITVLEAHKRVFVWIRYFERLGANSTWVATDKPFTVARRNRIVTCQLGKCEVTINTDNTPQTETWPACPFIYRNKVYVPLREMSEALGLQVNANTQGIVIN